MGILGTIIAGVLSGGATGLLGVLIERVFGFLNAKNELAKLRLQHEQALALANIESARAERRAEADERIADRQAEAAEEAAYARAMVASYEHDRATYLPQGTLTAKHWAAKFAVAGFALVDIARGLIRPGMTVYLCVVVTVMWQSMQAELALVNAQPTAAQLMELRAQITATILYCATTCVVWWFGARAPQNKARQN